MIQVGSKVRLKENLSRKDLRYYAKFDIFPGQQYTIVRIDKHTGTLYQIDTGYYVSVDDIEDLYVINLETILC